MAQRTVEGARRCMCSSAVSMVNIVAQPAVPGCMVSAACEMEEGILLATTLYTDHR